MACRLSQANLRSLRMPNTDATVAKSSETTHDALEALKGCPTESYVIIKQLGVSSADYADGRSAPSLSQYMAGMRPAVTTTYAVPEVIGEIDADAIVDHLSLLCGHKGGVTIIAAPGPDKEARMHSLQRAGM
jgi:hypothetical protein